MVGRGEPLQRGLFGRKKKKPAPAAGDECQKPEAWVNEAKAAPTEVTPGQAFWFEGVPYPTLDAAREAKLKKLIEKEFPRRSSSFSSPFLTLEDMAREVLLDPGMRVRIGEFLAQMTRE